MANNQLKEELILSTQHFDKKIDDVIKQVDKLKRQGSKVGDGFSGSMGKMIEKATGFNGSMGSLIGVVGKFGGILGVAVSAGEAFNKMINSSQALGDSFAAAQQQVNTVVDNFFQSLASGDFSPFLNGIDNLINRAKDAYDAMDSLWNMAQSFDVQNARTNNQFQKNLLEIRKLKGSKDPNDQKRIKELTAENERIIKQQASGANKLWDQTIKGLQMKIMSGTGMRVKASGGLIGSILESDINDSGNRKKFAAQYQKFLDERAKLDEKANKRQGEWTLGKYGANYRNESIALEKKYGQAIVANYLLNRLNDDELKAINDQYKQGLAYQGQAIANASKMLRYTKDTNSAASGGSKGGGNKGGGINKPQYAEGSVGYYQQLIRDLEEKKKLQIDSSEIDKINKEIIKAKYNLSELLNPTKKLGTENTTFKANVSFADSMNTNKKDLEGFLKRDPIKIPLDKTFKESFDEFGDKAGQITDTIFNFDGVISNMESLSNAISEGANAWEVFTGVLQTGMSIISTISSALQTLTMLQELFGTTATVAAEQSAAASEVEAAAATTNTVAKSGEAIAGATASGAKMPFPLNLVAIAAGVAAVIAALSMISGAFAEGGIVGGNSYSGDNLLARVNSGEMILNGHQQKNLFDLLDRGTTGGANGGNVTFTIAGSTLKGVLRNYDDKMNKVR